MNNHKGQTLDFPDGFNATDSRTGITIVLHFRREAVVKLFLFPFGWYLGRSPYVVMNLKLFSMNTLGQYYRTYMLVTFQFNYNMK